MAARMDVDGCSLSHLAFLGYSRYDGLANADHRHMFGWVSNYRDVY